MTSLAVARYRCIAAGNPRRARLALSMLMTPLQPGEKFEHFRIDALVIRTSMTTIYRATDLRTGQLVAVKIPHPELECDPTFYSRFQREKSIGKKLQHPGVVRTLPEDDLDQLCIVMEWVEGTFLREIIAKEGKLSPARASRIAINVCEALEYIHSQGVVHRDLKPENIMVGVDDRIKLIDFGISGAEGARRLTFSKLSNAMGTPDYISPEQARDPRSADVRSQLNPEVSPELQEIIFRALEREPEDRYASARALAEDLAHPENVVVVDRSARKAAKPARNPWAIFRKILSYAMLAIIPVLILTLMLFAARLK